MNAKKETRTTVLFQELEDISQGHKSYQTFLKELKEEKTFTSLKDFINEYMSQHKDLTIPSIVRDSNLSKNYVYHICDGRKTPSKYKLTALCIGAHMDLKETQKALSLAGCSRLHQKIPPTPGSLCALTKTIRMLRTLIYFWIKTA
ncbi:MAG TPA: hypothetical protein DF613_08140 [Lachnospiraceae bacterium]|nr:hypothetical protein [Lachnospiraceae bacterium]